MPFSASMAGSARSLNELRRPLSAPRVQPSASADAGGDFTLHSVAEVSEGARIRHAKFGIGVIEELDTAGTDARMIVRFDGETNPRTLLFKYAKFMIL